LTVTLHINTRVMFSKTTVLFLASLLVLATAAPTAPTGQCAAPAQARCCSPTSDTAGTLSWVLPIIQLTFPGAGLTAVDGIVGWSCPPLGDARWCVARLVHALTLLTRPGSDEASQPSTALCCGIVLGASAADARARGLMAWAVQITTMRPSLCRPPRRASLSAGSALTAPS
jgi:hypothetical protein